MASWSEMNGGARAGLVALGVAGIAVVGTLIWRANQPVPVPPEAVVAASEPAASNASPAAESAPVSEPIVVEPIAPSFDNWRVEADGSAVVSGRAEPGSMVSVLVDGRPVAEARTSGSGAFALLFTLAASDQPSVMMLEALLADGRQIFSAQTIALAPIPGPAPVAVASAEPAAPPAAVVVTEDTVTVIQPAEQEAASASVAEPAASPETVAPTQEVAAATPAPVEAPLAGVVVDAISYNAAGDVLLSGKGQAGQFARVYLDNVLTQSAEIAPSGTWQVTLVDTAPGIYTLRVDQVDAEGKVSARFETPFQRETRERLAALAQGATAPAEAEATAQAPVAEAPVAAANVEEAPVSPTQAPEASVTAPSVATPVASGNQEAQVSVPDQQAANSQVASGTAASSDAQTEMAQVVAQAPAVSATTESVQATTAPVAAPAATAAPIAAPAATAAPVAAPAVTAAPIATAQATTETEAAAPATAEPAAAAPQAATSPAVEAEANAPSLPTLDAPAAQPLASVGAEAAPPASAAPDTLAQPASDQAPGTVPATVSITVQPGYTLWGIARASLGDGVLYVQVYNANKDKIKNPDLIYPGQVFTLPVQE